MITQVGTTLKGSKIVPVYLCDLCKMRTIYVESVTDEDGKETLICDGCDNILFGKEVKMETPKSESSVKLTKNSKGYSWEIKAYDEDLEKAMAKIHDLDKKMKTLYGGTNENK